MPSRRGPDSCRERRTARTTSAPSRHHLRDAFGRILQVGIHGDDRLAPGVGQAGGDGGLKTEVAAELEQHKARVPPRVAPDQFRRAVPAAVVDEQGLPLRRGVGVKDRGQARQ